VATGTKCCATVCPTEHVRSTDAHHLVIIAPELLRQRIRELKSYLKDPNAPFGVDILVVKTGEGAKKSNIDYTFGRLDEMIDVIIEEKASLFVSAVGTPPPHLIQKLQKAGVSSCPSSTHRCHSPKVVDRCGRYCWSPEACQESP
jgi:NAD(P)H-dependent flavin oxidoreductase YrpB (nitropropane dioxygenase family)